MPELPLQMIEPQIPLPDFDIPKEMASEFEEKEVGDKVNAVMNFEVVEKTENGIEITIDGLILKNKIRRKL